MILSLWHHLNLHYKILVLFYDVFAREKEIIFNTKKTISMAVRVLPKCMEDRNVPTMFFSNALFTFTR